MLNAKRGLLRARRGRGILALHRKIVIAVGQRRDASLVHREFFLQPLARVDLASVHHQDRHRGAVQYVFGKPAENPFAQPAVAIGAHDDEGVFFGGGGE